ncbi:hypothetical protein [Paraburkholderia phenazinium]|uniref:Uncharacterized protein n=1 Tax=Paraburkholderia phenazinium TaxID=60549 RepID=A0A1N6EPT1_9BURK|nr:hypothetical protein [Paraburkholderia phenazinium]SIN85015.1 hypothetical protein SAMN05444168_0861 [Paraburkholderia phenazinium]
MKTATTLKLTVITAALLVFAGTASAAEVCVVDTAGDFCQMMQWVQPGAPCVCREPNGVFYGVAALT